MREATSYTYKCVVCFKFWRRAAGGAWEGVLCGSDRCMVVTVVWQVVVNVSDGCTIASGPLLLALLTGCMLSLFLHPAYTTFFCRTHYSSPPWCGITTIMPL